MSFDPIGDTGIFIGPYPQTAGDIDLLAAAKVTAVLNVQTQIDLDHRGVDWTSMTDYYASKGILAVHFPIHDFNEEDLTFKLTEASDRLHTLLLNKHKVYVHCTAGMGRAPAVVVCYLCRFRDFKVHEADAFVRSFRKVSVPNLHAIRAAINL